MATEDGLPIEENIRLAEEAIKQRIEQRNLQEVRTIAANEVAEQALQDFIAQDNHTNQESS